MTPLVPTPCAPSRNPPTETDPAVRRRRPPPSQVRPPEKPRKHKRALLQEVLPRPRKTGTGRGPSRIGSCPWNGYPAQPERQNAPFMYKQKHRGGVKRRKRGAVDIIAVPFGLRSLRVAQRHATTAADRRRFWKGATRSEPTARGQRHFMT